MNSGWTCPDGCLSSPAASATGGCQPLAILLVIILYSDLLKSFKFKKTEVYQAIFTFLFFSFVTLTIIGVFFRGEGMALIFPWN